ncbi:holo-[acyl-carrier protein] synthase [Peribacillus deserti]|uniref:Holo-[acyl-carrier-protein] synthase n=1 Tax=Peribacillus deserti TaxID=673318 RepID=A0ABS2QQS6_9BACI|nr:holo-ACP synthase [Peribacillus deserti]MBM7694586.1 holo-[acyl-carrier protein] synthase [Peribacillus deserti]
MIKGIGLDLIELKRIRHLINRKPKFADRILTESEKDIYDSLGERRKIEFLAGRFSAKEAFAKANGTGIGSKLSFLDIEILKTQEGKPFIFRPYSQNVHLSITHTSEYAAAQVIIEDI